MKGQFIINEFNGREIDNIGVVPFKQLLMVTNDAVGIMGLKDQRDVMALMDKLLEKVAFNGLKISDDSSDEEAREGFYYEAILALNLSLIALGPISNDIDVPESVRAEISSIMKTVVISIKRVTSLTKNLSIDMGKDYYKDIADILMDEINEYEKNNNE